MFNKLYERPSFVQAQINAPLLNERIDYIKSVMKKCKSLSAIQNTANYLLKIIDFLNLKQRRIVTLDEIDKAANNFATHRRKNSSNKIIFVKTRKSTFYRLATRFLKHCNLLDQSDNDIIHRIFKKRFNIQRHFRAPLLEERLQYLQYWSDHGATDSSLQGISRHLLIVMEHLNFYKKRNVSITEIEKATNYLRTKYRKNYRTKKYIKSASVNFIHISTLWLEMIGCLKKQTSNTKNISKDEKHLNDYIIYMREEQGLSESTIAMRYTRLDEFILLIHKKKKKLKNILPSDIDDVFIRKFNIDGYARNTVQSYASMIRSFIKYFENKKWCKKNLSDSIRAPRTYSEESIPYGPDWDDVKKILKQCNTKNPSDIRDRAILMLLSVYGMRRGEVVLLRLEDIDWKNERIYLRRVKRSKPQIFPLSKPVGDAILRYT